MNDSVSSRLPVKCKGAAIFGSLVLTGGGKYGRFRESRGGWSIAGKGRDGQSIVPRAETIVAKVLDGIPDVMILIA